MFSEDFHGANARESTDLGAECFKTGKKQISVAKAKEYFRRGAEEFDHGECQLALGEMYILGQIGSVMNLELAAYWFKKAFNNGVSEDYMLFTLGLIYLFGADNIATHEAEALKWIDRATEYCLEFYRVLGDFYYNGEVYFWKFKKEARQLIDRNYKKSVEWYSKAAQITCFIDHPAINIAQIYLTGGYGIKKNYKKALFWCENDRVEGTERSRRIIVAVYKEGDDGVQKNTEKALALCLNNGVAPFYFDAGDIYQFHIYPPDFASAAENYGLVREYDTQYSLARERLGYLYLKGLGVEQDINKAKSCLEIGNNPFYLGFTSHYAIGQKADYYSARQCYEKIKKGDELYGKAINQIGILYQQGRSYDGAVVDFEIANILFHESAEEGCHDAFNSLGDVYNYGYGEDVDYDEAFKWYSLAAQAPMDTGGQFNLGMMYSEGKGTKFDHKLALHWFEKAHHYGDERASPFIIRQFKLLAELSEKVATLEAQLNDSRIETQVPTVVLQMFSA